MTDEEIRAALQRYAETTRGRDELVRRALAADLTKMEIHELSGIARTTIDRITSERDHAA
jgi:hypothetical protein